MPLFESTKFVDFLVNGSEVAKEDIRREKTKRLCSFIREDLAGLILLFPYLLSHSGNVRRKEMAQVATRIGRLRYEIYFIKQIARRLSYWCWLRIPKAPEGTIMHKPRCLQSPARYVYNLRKHRIGDKVAVSALLNYVKEVDPSCEIVLIDDIYYLGGRTSEMPARIIFKDLVDEIWTIKNPEDYRNCEELIRRSNLKPLAFTPDLTPVTLNRESGCCENSDGALCYGNPWLMLPSLAKIGIYPKIAMEKVNLPKEVKSALGNARQKKIVTVHILEDAQYNTERNHDFSQIEKLCQSILTQINDVFIVRVGEHSGKTLDLAPGCGFDATPYGLTVIQSAKLIEMADLYIGGDTGMTHLAGALDVPHIVAIYGYGYDLSFTLRNCFHCVVNTRLAEAVSTFPSVPPGRLTKVTMKYNSFDYRKVSKIVEQKIKGFYPNQKQVLP